MRKTIDLSEDVFEMVEAYKEKNHLKSFTCAMEEMIRNSEKEYELEERISKRVSDELYKILTRIRLGSNSADINSQVIVEILNAMVYQFDVSPLATGVKETDTVRQAKNYVREKIAEKKQKKDYDSIGKK